MRTGGYYYFFRRGFSGGAGAPGNAQRLPVHVDSTGYRAEQRIHVSWDSQNPSTLSKGGDQYTRLLDATSIRPAER